MAAMAAARALTLNDYLTRRNRYDGLCANMEVAPEYDRATAASAEASAAAMEALTNVRTVAAFGAEQLEADKYRAKCAEAARESLGSAVATGLNGALVAAILYSTWALGLWYGSYLIRSDMADRDECNYRVMEDGDVREPANDCVTGGDIMTAFLCVLFGGLALLQALPGIAAFTLATAEAPGQLYLLGEDGTWGEDGGMVGALRLEEDLGKGEITVHLQGDRPQAPDPGSPE